MSIRWYGLDSSLRTVEHDIVNLDEAYVLVDRYLEQAKPHFESGEEALAATMFGFCRPDKSYMQICIHAPNSIDLEHDFSLIGNPLLRLVGGRDQGNEHLTSRDDLRARTRQFFTLSVEAFRRTLRSERKAGPVNGGGHGA